MRKMVIRYKYPVSPRIVIEFSEWWGYLCIRVLKIQLEITWWDNRNEDDCQF